ncbi:UvrD-helicase domain-containing protein, partial [Cerasicoccus arenae]
MPRPPLADQPDRNRFTQELDRNFSVTAPAGVGKTTAIVSRVVALAKSDQNRADPALPRLSVVTYTRKAADEMRRRTAQELQKVGAGPEIFARFHQAFFGTIHSFCLELLRMFGPLAGLSPQFEQINNEDAIWWEFLRGSDSLLQSLPEDARESFARHAALSKVYGLVKEFGAQIPEPTALGPAPAVDVSPILNFKPKNKVGLKGIEKGQLLANQWLSEYDNDGPCALPDFGGGSADFKLLWAETWMPLKEWLGEAYLYLAANLAREFRDFRVSRGQINYDDMVALAAQLLEHPVVGPAIREQNRLVILDEAQDTDRLQFVVLMNVAGAQWTPDQPLHAANGPPAGHFCQVGDPQQAIYGSRADLATYREVHESLVALNAAEALSFTVTMRCDEAIVSAVNQFYPNILRPPGQEGDQAEFVPLHARPTAGPGKVDRLHLPPDSSLPEKPSSDDRAEAEARALARWMRETGCEGIGASDWSDISILAPRNAWIETLTNALERENLPVQTHSRSESRASDPLWAWISALVRVLAFPEDAFEIAGVLREVFALPDDVIARYVKQRTPEASAGVHALSLPSDIADGSTISEALNTLNCLRQEVQDLALGDAFRLITERLKLRDRFAALPELDPASIDTGLKRLQANALCAEEQGSDLAEWSRELILARESNQESDDPKPGFIQLLSCHKAKGLQWVVVIVPFIHREVTFAPQNYPRLYRATVDEPAMVAFDKQCGTKRGQHKQQLEAQELERLAYVSWTRARQRLILVDGQAYYKTDKAKGNWIALWAAANNGANAQAWANLPDFQAEELILPEIKSPKRDISTPEPLPPLFPPPSQPAPPP